MLAGRCTADDNCKEGHTILSGHGRAAVLYVMYVYRYMDGWMDRRVHLRDRFFKL